jgi:hypothetical protein
MKKSILNLRLDESTKEALDAKCLENGVSVSTGAREAIKLYLKDQNSLNNQFAEGNESMEEDFYDEPYYNEDFAVLKSWLFTRFIYWVMNKRHDPFIRIDHNFCKQYMSLITEIENNSYFSDEMKAEFSKIYKELNEYLYGNTHNRYQFKFPQHGGFNYSHLIIFMENMDCTEDGLKIITIISDL